MKVFKYLVFLLCLNSCIINDPVELILNDNITLLDELEGKNFITDAVIACAANDIDNTDLLNVYFYPETGATNFKFYETNIFNVDPNNFENYVLLDIEDEPFLDGTLRQFKRSFNREQWIIVTYELNDRINISTPIRTKNVLQPTLWTDEVMINQDQTGMPSFDWTAESEDNNAIFFEIVTTVNDTVLSATYTNDSEFQYYNLNNVVLNITEGTPEGLEPGEIFNITIMDVSIDNWVNTVYKREFIAE